MSTISASPEAGSAVMAAVFAYPQDANERRTRIYYFLAFLFAKSCSLALTFVPPKSDGLASLLFALSVGNFVASFVLDACARRETRRWAGDSGPETRFWHCLIETFIGQWLTHKLIEKSSRAWAYITGGGGKIRLEEEEEHAQEASGPVSSIFGSSKPDPLDEWAKDISFAYNCGMFIKKALAAAIVVLRFLYDRWNQQPASLDIAARVLSSFVSLVLVDVLDGLAKEETRLKSKPVKGGVLSKLLGVFS